jgi:hypothetical protein
MRESRTLDGRNLSLTSRMPDAFGHSHESQFTLQADLIYGL